MTEPSDTKWIDLARRVTESERVYARLGEEGWRDYDVTKALRYRGMAEGLAMARDHQLEVSAESRRAEIVGPTPLEAAMHSVWLHGKWRRLTQEMASEEREAAADAVLRVHHHIGDEDGDLALPIPDLRWWRS